MEGTVAARSPVHDAVERLNPEWVRVGSTPVALHFGNPEGEATLKERLAICDVSALKRFGVKGPNAHRWLEDHSIGVPEPVNSWSHLPDRQGLVARLGRSEFLIEDGPDGSATERLRNALNSGAQGIYPVLRQDAALALTGERAREVMLQVCGVDFGSLDQEAHPVVLTRIAVTSAVVLPRVERGAQTFRIWCSSPYGMYLWEELRKIVDEFGGGVVGFSALYGGG